MAHDQILSRIGLRGAPVCSIAIGLKMARPWGRLMSSSQLDGGLEMKHDGRRNPAPPKPRRPPDTFWSPLNFSCRNASGQDVLRQWISHCTRNSSHQLSEGASVGEGDHVWQHRCTDQQSRTSNCSSALLMFNRPEVRNAILSTPRGTHAPRAEYPHTWHASLCNSCRALTERVEDDMVNVVRRCVGAISIYSVTVTLGCEVRNLCRKSR